MQKISQFKTILLVGFVVLVCVQSPAATLSVNGASIIPGNAQSVSQIVDAKSNVWTLKSGVVYENGKLAGSSAGVIDLFDYNNVIYQENGNKGFWSWNGTTWVASTIDPRVTNANNTILLSTASTMLVDSKQNLWAISGGVVYENGALAASSAGVTELIYSNSTIYQENSAGLFWSWTGTAWVACSSPIGATPSVNGASIIPGNSQSVSQIIDASHNKWTLSSGVVYENGKLAGSSAGVIDLFDYNNVIYQENGNKGFWSWNGTTWVASTIDPRVTNANNTILLSAASTMLVDSKQNLWAISGGVAYENGAPAGSSSGVIELIYANSTIYQENKQGAYWAWNTPNWNAASDPLTSPTPPPQAVALGFTKLTLNQGGSAGWNIDVNNTGTAGYDWYLKEDFNGGPTPTSEFNVSNGVLTISGNGAYNWQLATAEASANSNGYVGTVYSGGYYTEASLEIGPNCGSDATGFWADAIEHWHPKAYPSDQWPGQASNYEQWVEVDYMESYASNFTFGILSWFGIYQTTCGSKSSWCNFGNDNGTDGIPWNNQEIAGIYGTTNGTVPSGTNVTTKFNTFGALIVPSQLNNGTGYAQGYFNNTKSTKNPNTWTAYSSSVAPKPYGENAFSAIDKDHYMIILGASPNTSCTLKADWVRVWQKP